MENKSISLRQLTAAQLNCALNLHLNLYLKKANWAKKMVLVRWWFCSLWLSQVAPLEGAVPVAISYFAIVAPIMMHILHHLKIGANNVT